LRETVTARKRLEKVTADWLEDKEEDGKEEEGNERQ